MRLTGIGSGVLRVTALFAFGFLVDAINLGGKLSYEKTVLDGLNARVSYGSFLLVLTVSVAGISICRRLDILCGEYRNEDGPKPPPLPKKDP